MDFRYLILEIYKAKSVHCNVPQFEIKGIFLNMCTFYTLTSVPHVTRTCTLLTGQHKFWAGYWNVSKTMKYSVHAMSHMVGTEPHKSPNTVKTAH